MTCTGVIDDPVMAIFDEILFRPLQVGIDIPAIIRLPLERSHDGIALIEFIEHTIGAGTGRKIDLIHIDCAVRIMKRLGGNIGAACCRGGSRVGGTVTAVIGRAGEVGFFGVTGIKTLIADTEAHVPYGSFKLVDVRNGAAVAQAIVAINTGRFVVVHAVDIDLRCYLAVIKGTNRTQLYNTAGSTFVKVSLLTLVYRNLVDQLRWKLLEIYGTVAATLSNRAAVKRGEAQEWTETTDRDL